VERVETLTLGRDEPMEAKELLQVVQQLIVYGSTHIEIHNTRIADELRQYQFIGLIKSDDRTGENQESIAVSDPGRMG
jgi:hypothetical protein